MRLVVCLLFIGMTARVASRSLANIASDQAHMLAQTPADIGVRRSTARRTSTRREEVVGATGVVRAARPRTAILLVGRVSDYDYEGWLPHFQSGMVAPTAASIFIHSEEVPRELRQALGDAVKDVAEEPESDCKTHGRHPNCQFWHLRGAWNLMEKFENNHGFTYDVVVKARTGMVPISPSYLDLAGWRTANRIHMMADLIVWGLRQDMAHVARYYEDGINTYYKTTHPDAFQRPINVKALLDSIQRDARLSTGSTHASGPRASFEDHGKEDWRLYTKLELLFYPDMGRRGAVANLQAALEAGMETMICDGEPLRKTIGRPAYSGSAPKPALSSTACKTHCGDYCESDSHQETRAENDLPDWIISHGMVVCDVGANMKHINVKGVEWLRSNASDCEKRR